MSTTIVDNVYVADDLRTRLIDVGVEILEAEGLEALTIRAVTRRIGVSHGAPRRYFPTLNALAAAVARRGLIDLASELELAAARAPSARESLDAIALNYVAFAERRPAMFALIFRHDLLENSGEKLRGASIPMYTTLATAIAEFAPKDPQFAALRLWTSVHGIATLKSTRALQPIGRQHDTDELVVGAVRDAISESATAPKT